MFSVGVVLLVIWSLHCGLLMHCSGGPGKWFLFDVVLQPKYYWWPLQGSNAIRVSKICQRYNTRRCPGRDDVLVQMVPSCWHGMSNRWSYLPRRSSSLIWSEMIFVLIAKIVTDSWFHISSYSCPTFVFPHHFRWLYFILIFSDSKIRPRLHIDWKEETAKYVSKHWTVIHYGHHGVSSDGASQRNTSSRRRKRLDWQRSAMNKLTNEFTFLWKSLGVGTSKIPQLSTKWLVWKK